MCLRSDSESTESHPWMRWTCAQHKTLQNKTAVPSLAPEGKRMMKAKLPRDLNTHTNTDNFVCTNECLPSPSGFWSPYRLFVNHSNIGKKQLPPLWPALQTRGLLLAPRVTPVSLEKKNPNLSKWSTPLLYQIFKILACQHLFVTDILVRIPLGTDP